MKGFEIYHSPIFLPFKSFQRVLKIMECFKSFRHIDSHFASKQVLKGQTIGGLMLLGLCGFE